jgi:hypothetical protein
MKTIEEGREVMDASMSAFCGLDCRQCPAYAATQQNSDELRAKTAAEWSAMFKADIKAEQIDCDGCKSSTGPRFFYCSMCGIRSCATGRDFGTCAECDDFPCDQVKFVIDRSPEARAALEALREVPKGEST